MITAKLSQKFYDTFGDDITNELVTWFNDVDATYRADLRDLNETNFARFDAKLEQRLAEADAKWEGRRHRLLSTAPGRDRSLSVRLLLFLAPHGLAAHLDV